MASEIAVVGEQQKQINLIRQQNELMLIQAKLRENIAAQAELAQAGPGLLGGAENEAADKQAQQAFDANMDALKNEQAEIEGDMGVVTAEIQAANQAIADAISDLEDRLKTEIKAIREGDGNEDEKAKAEAEAKAKAEKEMLKAGRVAGEQAGDDAAVKQDLKDAERQNAEDAKLAKQRTDEEKKAIAAQEKADKKRQQEALGIAKDLVKDEEATKGTTGISSMAAIGGGGGVGVGGNIPQQQLDVQKKAADILEKMLNVLAVPEVLGENQDEALNQLMGKLTNEEKKVAIAGFENLMQAAQQEGVNDEQRDALKAQAMDLLNGLAEQAAKRNFNPEGGGLPQALFNLPVVNGQNGMPQQQNNPIDIQNQPNDDPIAMIKQTNTTLAEISKKLDKSVILGEVEVVGGGLNA
jgi:hypothetical protein